MYAEGEGLDLDIVKAYAWCGTSAANGVPLGAECVESLGQKMDEVQKDQARRLTKDYRERYRAEVPKS
jgi:hypothetical protein